MLEMPPASRPAADSSPACSTYPTDFAGSMALTSPMRRRLLVALGGVSVPAFCGVSALALFGSAEAQAATLDKAALDDLFSTPVTGLDGKPATLAAYRGKRLLVNFWATWCAPCRREMPELTALASARKDLTVVGVAVEEELKGVNTFLKSMGVSYSNVLIPPMAGLGLMRRLGNSVGGLPYSIMIEANGNPLLAKVGSVTRDEIEAKLPRG